MNKFELSPKFDLLDIDLPLDSSQLEYVSHLDEKDGSALESGYQKVVNSNTEQNLENDTKRDDSIKEFDDDNGGVGGSSHINLNL